MEANVYRNEKENFVQMNALLVFLSSFFPLLCLRSNLQWIFSVKSGGVSPSPEDWSLSSFRYWRPHCRRKLMQHFFSPKYLEPWSKSEKPQTSFIAPRKTTVVEK